MNFIERGLPLRHRMGGKKRFIERPSALNLIHFVTSVKRISQLYKGSATDFFLLAVNFILALISG